MNAVLVAILHLVALGRPRGDLVLECLERAQPPRETLGREGAEFVLGDVQPTAVLRRSSRWASGRAAAGGKASYKAPRVWVLRLSSTSTTVRAAA